MFDELFEAWKREKESQEILPLPQGFYSNLAVYIKKIREERRMIDGKSVRGILCQREEQIVKKIAEDLVQARYDKLMKKPFQDETASNANLAKEEEKLFGKFSNLNDILRLFISNLLEGKDADFANSNPSGFMIVRIIQETPEIKGNDNKTYGPYRTEDLVNLPKEEGITLIEKGLAMEVKTL